MRRENSVELLCKFNRGDGHAVLRRVGERPAWVNGLKIQEDVEGVRFTRSASPLFFGGVSSSGRLSINFTYDLHSTGEKKSCTRFQRAMYGTVRE